MSLECGDSQENEKIVTAKRICNSLQSEDRKVRKNAYIEMEKYLSSGNVDFSQQDLKNIFIETYMYTLNGLRDKTEAVREQAINFINFLIINKLPLNDYYLTYIFPVIVERIGSVEIIEESEEIRLQLLQLLDAIIGKYSKTEQLKPFLGDSVIILSETVKDKYPAIKELSNQTIVKLADALPKDFHMQAETLIKPVLTCFTHQRYKVRVEAIKSIGKIILHATYKGLQDVLGPMAERLFDQIPLVRRTVAQVAAEWLLTHRDRYSYFAKVLPLLLTGLNDEVEETRVEAHLLWDKVGLQFQQENTKDLKDQLDYLTTMPKYYPEEHKRPNLGCRTLVQRNVGNIAPALAKELLSWQGDVRFRCSQLLCSIALLAEEGLTMHLQELLPAMYSAARDEDARVVENIRLASELIGLFVPYDTWSQIVLPAVEDGAHYGHLLVLAGLIKGTPKEYIKNYVDDVSKLLAEDYICFGRKKLYQVELMNCVQQVYRKYDSGLSWELTGFNLFKVIVVLMALGDADNHGAIIDDLAKHLGEESGQNLWDMFTQDVLKHINVEPKLWTKTSDHCCVFLTVISECNEAFGVNLEIIADVLEKALDDEADGEQKLNTLYVLSEVFGDKKLIFKNAENLTQFLEKLITDIFVPNLVWHAGATAEAVRTMSAQCLKYALQPTEGVDLFSSSDVLKGVFEKLQPLLLSLVEDASYRSRLLGVECLVLLKENACRKDVWSVEDLGKIYPEVLKRLDDPTDKVRVCALHSLPTLLRDAPNNFKENYYKAHHELIIDTLLTHFDDDDENIQNLVYDVLKVMAEISKRELVKKLERHRKVLRNQRGCDRLMEYTQNFICL
ncbi:unnamed protein product [Brassicogethes aeneus]|uniref:Uncharacterized protein n=1 Tax=Brassicogethes aeneus TaxID=1431903 RepID=A0A9P0BJS9_BRAAE|nr:unnamed protein product [Brassicogethes aeneus]